VKKFLKSSGRFLGYTVFFVGALVFFVYLTLPVDEARDFLVRKASDEYNADLVFADEDSLEVCGLACVEARNVTFTVRPTAEELALYQEEQRIWKEWKEADSAAKGEAKAPDAEAVASEAAPSAPDEVAANPETVAAEGALEGLDVPAPEGSAPGSEGEKKPEKSLKSSALVSKAPAPRKPEWPAQPIELASLRAELSAFKMLGGLVEGRLQAELLGGTLDAEVSQTPEEMKIKGTLTNIDVAQLTLLKRVMPLPMAGMVSVDLDLAVELDDKKKPKLDLITGTATVHIRNAFVGPGQIESKKLGGAFPYFDVPKTRIEDLGGRIVFEKRKATFEDFNIRGPDIEGEITGYLQLAADLGRWGARSHIRFKFSDTFLEQHKDVKTAMTSIAYLKQGQLEGYTGFGVTGDFGKLKWKPTKVSPYKGRARAEARADKEAEDKDGEETTKRPEAVDRTSKSRPERLRRALEKSNEKDPPLPTDAPTGGTDVTAGRKPFARPPSVVPDPMPLPEPVVAEEPVEEPEEASPTVVEEPEEVPAVEEAPTAEEPGTEEGEGGAEEAP